MDVFVIGGGLAGSEAALTLADDGFHVKLFEMRPFTMTPAHKTGDFAELVCSNSLGSLSQENAKGELIFELTKLGSHLIRYAFLSRVGGDKALVVDREKFSLLVTDAIKNHPNIDIEQKKCSEVPSTAPCIIAPGPLASGDLVNFLSEAEGTLKAEYYDASSPSVLTETIDMDYAFWGNRFDEGADYLNVPLSKTEYEWFVEELLSARMGYRHEFDSMDSFFERCLPIEEIAHRGKESLAFGPMRPTNLNIPDRFKDVYAVIQLRKENDTGSILNMVGFQTGISQQEQLRIFKSLPAFKNAVFVRLGQIHQNTFLPGAVNRYFQSKSHANWFYAGQFTGTEGYVEAIAGGLWAAINLSRFLKNEQLYALPEETMLGGLTTYVETTLPSIRQPMGSNWGLVPSVKGKKSQRKVQRAEKARIAIENAVRELGRTAG
ncbi:methylenetetrahydrofolate--tRNA-(uracil(54)-C(5))-methyltransferase (FADH(2)-oxidizing) TrmFO [Coprothermobacter platensis]|uniref:methylenetetrahydrofolate--tRNA-(uracil(54)- C(5))-methyltransferase (FADH(2)-oxidizing) TrmFO n=1 Tax=Coprothermobacter platensis TaxID=108819 RepID=UPI0003763828|nr:methylenetetrahydrofolate--tRNA-(uracil(54)-C(5))-methyltransferase (FADH(2)-oxidizing) TrmFO [Coprothermobacter platensis]